MTEIPQYKGALGPASWAEFKVTERVGQNLVTAALMNCKHCGGHGWTGNPERALICPCVNRPLNKNEKKSQEDLFI